MLRLLFVVTFICVNLWSSALFAEFNKEPGDWEIITVKEGEKSWFFTGWSDGKGLVLIGSEEGKLYRSEDNGKTWKIIKLPFDNFVSELTGSETAGIFLLPNSENKIYHSLDKGLTWSPITVPVKAEVSVLALELKEDKLTVCGEKGLIYRSENSGKTWEKLHYLEEDPDVLSLYSVISGEKHIIAVGSGGTTVSSQDNGKTWTITYQNPPFALNAVWDNDSGTYVVGTEGRIWKSVDQGLNWSQQTKGVPQDWLSFYDHTTPILNDFNRSLNGITGNSDNNLYVVGSHGMILHTTDGGENWIQEKSNSDRRLLRVWTDKNRICVVGEEATLLCKRDK